MADFSPNSLIPLLAAVLALLLVSGAVIAMGLRKTAQKKEEPARPRPDLPFVVVWFAGSRFARIKTGLIDLLDMWVLCLGAGMSFQSSLIRVASEPDLIDPVLRRELLLTNEEINAGCSREQALKNFSRRCGDGSEIKGLVFHIIQSERFGNSLTQTLKTYSDTLRFKRREDVKELIQKLPVKLAFPLVFFILPALFVVILGPAALQLSVILSGR